MTLEPPKTIKAIPGYPGYYADIDGSIWSYKSTNNKRKTFKWRHLKGSIKKSGYLGIALHTSGRIKHTHVHHAIGLAFLGERPEGFDINHKDGVKTNNKPANLEYCTKSENIKHAFRLGLRKNNMTPEIAKLGNKASIKSRPGRPVIGIRDGEVVYRFSSAREAAIKLNINVSNIRSIANGNKKCLLCGCKWRYVQ